MRKWLPLLIDIVLVIVFCAIGRRSHDEAVAAGLLRTVWPFGAGLLIGWVIALAIAGRGRPSAALARVDGSAVWPTGVVVWLSTLIGGMVLRVLSGQGTAVSFVIVAATVLAVFLLGWRAVWAVAARRIRVTGAPVN
ncbi:DUF3054 domain-containing protein [Nocardia cerradoensis]|uniref:DUF3054 domain-containing protein n=1 Tax=Nocardia cerradoensis TaxID=85688 RepID=A0A231HBR2_9NOCA|nr:DUF3054 domain-containing protein [Nocardia cerradoensis]NKY46902.1 DUF3054 domain-containing protein [Nocardia cerradoensis]OXR46275.1 hypothetical protein B7C42_01241 [Nocardia cerradoensis]